MPEIVEWTRALSPRELVLEGEAIAMRADGRPFPFQETMSRFGRSKDVAAARAAVPLTSFFFDVLLRSGEGSLVALPYAERARMLAETVEPGRLLPRIVTADRGEAERFLRRALDDGHEGLMAKSLSASYAAGQRGFSWLKLKAAHTLDLVVIAVEWGSGRREGWLSNLHLGARDPASGQFVMLGKTFKGLTDELLRWQTERLLSLRDRTRRPRRARAAGAGRGDRVQRRPGVAALSRRPGAAVRAGEALPHRQAGGRGGHDRHRARAVRKAARVTVTWPVRTPRPSRP